MALNTCPPAVILPRAPLLQNFLDLFLLYASCYQCSSVARGGAIAPPIGLPTKVPNKENATFLELLRLSFALD